MHPSPYELVPNILRYTVNNLYFLVRYANIVSIMPEKVNCSARIEIAFTHDVAVWFDKALGAACFFFHKKLENSNLERIGTALSTLRKI